jgi:rfaE bifunctional protein nucleotidyltransferase chain/domain
VVSALATGTTPEKIRISAQDRPIMRLDRGRLGGVTLSASFLRSARNAISRADAVLVADYGNGLDRLLDALGDVVDTVPVVWDPHPRGPAPRPTATVVTPSAAEAAAASGLARRHDLDDLRNAVADSEALVKRWRVGSVATTCGASGAVLARSGSSPLVVPCPRVHTVRDTCGAGDAFASAATAALARGAVLSEAIEQAVTVASEFVAAGGARNVRVDGSPARDGCDAVATADYWRGHHPGGPTRPAEVVVAAGGCFDVVHAGHVRMLEQARRLGDRLVVLMNGDASVRRLKGPSRPVNGADDRAAVLRALACVDDVVIFDDDTPHMTLRRLRPALFVKGGDYGEELSESSVLDEWGGKVVTLPYLAGRSTTGILAT